MNHCLDCDGPLDVDGDCACYDADGIYRGPPDRGTLEAQLRESVVREYEKRHPVETRITDPVTGGQKGQKLAQIGALDPAALLEVGKVAGFGASKYARYNFVKGYAWSLSYDALQRHLHAFWNGESRDPESDRYHLAHAAWHCMALLTFEMRERGTDDRIGGVL